MFVLTFYAIFLTFLAKFHYIFRKFVLEYLLSKEMCKFFEIESSIISIFLCIKFTKFYQDLQDMLANSYFFQIYNNLINMSFLIVQPLKRTY